MQLIVPDLAHLDGYTDALRRGWSPDNVRVDEAPLEELARIEADPAAFVASLDDPEAKAGPITLPDGGSVEIGRYPVTTAEFQRWAESSGFHDAEHWSEEGASWKDTTDTAWTALAASPESASLVVPNQPVAGVTWWEAEAYARAHGARLLSANEHRSACRGHEKRPYP